MLGFIVLCLSAEVPWKKNISKYTAVLHLKQLSLKWTFCEIRQKCRLLENAGIDPATSRMLSEHSTIWANSPTLPLDPRLEGFSFHQSSLYFGIPQLLQRFFFWTLQDKLVEAWVAQTVEHQTFNLRVQGSSPCSGGSVFAEGSLTLFLWRTSKMCCQCLGMVLLWTEKSKQCCEFLQIVPLTGLR